MAKILVQAETNPSIMIQLTDPEGEDNWNGTCTQCGHTVSPDLGMQAAIEEADVHVDQHHGEE